MTSVLSVVTAINFWSSTCRKVTFPRAAKHRCSRANSVKRPPIARTCFRHISLIIRDRTLCCYLCPYCTTSSNSMDAIEDHVGEKHPSEVFRFEVLQEKIDYLQNMLTCPICNGGYIWQKPFISHLESVHQIKDVVDYLLTHYNEKSLPDKAKVPRSYFRNLLPDTPDYDMEHDHLGEGDPSNDENFQTLDGDEPRVTSILEAHLVGSGSQEDSYSGMYAEGVEFSERFPPADLSQYVIKKGTPTTFSCDMCPFECVKTAHFRRHLEVHRRNEFMHNRLNCIRFHLGKYHRDEPYKTRIVDNSIISYGPEDDPTLGRSKAKKPFLTASTPNNEKEKRLPIKFEPSSPTTEDDLQAILQFEKQLPTAMIYQDPIKCTKCDFRNRVRINLIRHLKLHKEDRMPNGSSADRSVSGQADHEMEKKGRGRKREGQEKQTDSQFSAGIPDEREGIFLRRRLSRRRRRGHLRLQNRSHRRVQHQVAQWQSVPVQGVQIHTQVRLRIFWTFIKRIIAICSVLNWWNPILVLDCLRSSRVELTSQASRGILFQIPL